MGKLAWFKYNNSISETDAKNTCNGYACNYCVPPKELNSPNVENKKNCSETASNLLEFLTPLPDSMKQKPSPTDLILFNSSTVNDTKKLPADNINKNVPTTSTGSSAITMNYCQKKYSSTPGSKLSKCITPSTYSTKLKPLTVKIPQKNTVIDENLTGGTINDNELDNNLIPQQGTSVSQSNVSDPVNNLYKKITFIENVITGMNSRVTKSLINQDKIISLIEKQNRKTLSEKLVDKVSSEFENYFTFNFPLRTLDDVIELENLLIEKQYYKLLKTKLLSFAGVDLKSVMVNILTKLFTRNVAAKITLSATPHIKRTTLETINKINLQNKKIYKLIIDVVMETFKCDEEQIKTVIRVWLRHAKERYDEVDQTKIPL